MCFFCNLGLKFWSKCDNTSREHARFSPHCFFLKVRRVRACVSLKFLPSHAACMY
jgi:hypothetical protein